MAVKCTILPEIALSEIAKIAYGLNCKDNSINLINSYIEYLNCPNILVTDCVSEDCINNTRTYYKGCKSLPYNIYTSLVFSESITKTSILTCLTSGYPNGNTIDIVDNYKSLYIKFFEDIDQLIPLKVSPLNLPVLLVIDKISTQSTSTILIGDGITLSDTFYLGDFTIDGTLGLRDTCETEEYFTYYSLSEDNCFGIATFKDCLQPFNLQIDIGLGDCIKPKNLVITIAEHAH